MSISPPLEERPEVWTITQITRRVKNLLEREIGHVWVSVEISNFRVSPAGHSYFTLKDERSHLAEIRTSERKLARVLEIDDKDEGIEFITIDEAESSRRPISPKAQSILMLAFGVGLAFGACAVFLREFFDHTFHAASAVSFSLGVPVLEGIDEILLPADRRRLLARKLVMVPVGCAFLSVLVVSGSLAYLSLEHPQRFKRIVEKASITWDHVNLFG